MSSAAWLRSRLGRAAVCVPGRPVRTPPAGTSRPLIRIEDHRGFVALPKSCGENSGREHELCDETSRVLWRGTLRRALPVADADAIWRSPCALHRDRVCCAPSGCQRISRLGRRSRLARRARHRNGCRAIGSAARLAGAWTDARAGIVAVQSVWCRRGRLAAITPAVEAGHGPAAVFSSLSRVHRALTRCRHDFHRRAARRSTSHHPIGVAAILCSLRTRRTCPTFLTCSGDELDSRQGRIYLIKDMLEQTTGDRSRSACGSLPVLPVVHDVSVRRELHASSIPRTSSKPIAGRG